MSVQADREAPQQVRVGQVWHSERYGDLRVIKVGKRKATLHGRLEDVSWVTITAWIDRPWFPEMRLVSE